MNILNEGITTAILSYITLGDKSLDSMLEEMANESSQSRVQSSAGGDEAQAIPVLQIPATMPVDLRAMLVICAIHLGETLPEVSMLCVFEPIMCGWSILETPLFKYVSKVEIVYTTHEFT